MLCSKCGSTDHEERDCGAIGAGTGAPGTGPDDSDLAPLGGGAGRSRLKTVVGGLIGLVVIGAIAGVIALRSGKPGAAKAGKAVATTTAKPPTGDTIALGCSIPTVGDEIEATCDWAKDGGVIFENLRWDGDVLRGNLVVTLTNGKVYASKEMEVKVQKTKTPVTLAAR